MGWTTYRKTHKTIKEFFEQQWNSEDDKIKKTVLAAAQVGFTEAYAAIEFLNKKELSEKEPRVKEFAFNSEIQFSFNLGDSIPFSISCLSFEEIFSIIGISKYSSGVISSILLLFILLFKV